MKQYIRYFGIRTLLKLTIMVLFTGCSVKRHYISSNDTLVKKRVFVYGKQFVVLDSTFRSNKIDYFCYDVARKQTAWIFKTAIGKY